MLLTARKLNSPRAFVLLAPKGAELAPFSGDILESDDWHTQLMSQMQRLRGRVYLNDGAIQSTELSPDQRHISDADDESWHLLTVNSTQRVLGCARFHLHPNTVSFEQLGIRHASIVRSAQWAAPMRSAVHTELRRAQRAGFRYLELGGWALADELRGTTEALQFALSTFSWSQLIGGALGIGTVTERNSSAAILRRLGGLPLEWGGSPIPPYYDERYRCGMELLRFDSRYPNPKYGPTIENLRDEIARLPIVCPVSENSSERSVLVPSRSELRWNALTAA